MVPSRSFVPAVQSNMRAFARQTCRSVKHQQQHAYPVARSETQRRYLEVLHNEATPIVIASGSAGSGKTALATHVGVQKLKEQKVKRIIITRPAICVDEEHGFLPGTLEQKMEPWIRPVFDVLNTHFSSEAIKQMMASRVIELCPLAFMRGRTFERSWIICDEAQNCTPNQMLMVMTRIGLDSKLVITGDPTQFDRGFEVNGLNDVVNRIQQKNQDQNHDEDIAVVYFSSHDVVRHPVIPKVLSLYHN